MPTAALPGIGASIRSERAERAIARSSESPSMRLTLTCGAGWTSYCVTTGPALRPTILASISKLLSFLTICSSTQRWADSSPPGATGSGVTSRRSRSGSWNRPGRHGASGSSSASGRPRRAGRAPLPSRCRGPGEPGSLRDGGRGAGLAAGGRDRRRCWARRRRAAARPRPRSRPGRRRRRCPPRACCLGVERRRVRCRRRATSRFRRSRRAAPWLPRRARRAPGAGCPSPRRRPSGPSDVAGRSSGVKVEGRRPAKDARTPDRATSSTRRAERREQVRTLFFTSARAIPPPAPRVAVGAQHDRRRPEERRGRPATTPREREAPARARVPFRDPTGCTSRWRERSSGRSQRKAAEPRPDGLP